MPMFMWAQSLGWEDPQEEGMATHLSILAWEIPWTEEPGGLQSVELQSYISPGQLRNQQSIHSYSWTSISSFICISKT